MKRGRDGEILMVFGRAPPPWGAAEKSEGRERVKRKGEKKNYGGNVAKFQSV